MPPLEGPFGFVVIDKPAGFTSHACISRLRRCYGLKRVGHGGTLDPAVTGVLPVALGLATRLFPYMPGEKDYRGVIQLGIRTSSDDLQGEILKIDQWPKLDQTSLIDALAQFRGTIQQRPPRISAVHISGKRAHMRARRGEFMKLPLRMVTIEQLNLIHWNAASGRLTIEVRCSAGTYIRALARDLGELLGCGGCLAELTRTQALGFDLKQAHPLPELDTPLPRPLSPLHVLWRLPKYAMTNKEEMDWRCGKRLTTSGSFNNGDVVVVCNSDGSMAGMGLCEPNQQLQPKVVFDAIG
ncbi:tRNA pseudouridine(55) synthase TruB [Synechococcus sp. M16CYN]|uniref:tRNA pseudouridine(55) synthase TruB n=1 Tax=Synechococcus sp. M16CYN TaxID=3103139 RepID=UPI0030E56735